VSHAALLASAARTAQRVLAPMADPDGEGEFTVTGGGTFAGICEEDPNMLNPTANAVEPVYGLRIAAEREQFTAAEEATLAGLAITRARVTAKGKAWTLISVTPAAQFLQFVCVTLRG
jgi:hypothetical protein